MPFISELEQIFIQRLYTGWVTLRNQLTTPIKLVGRRIIELYDALIAGNDWEVTPRLSLKRRAGHTLYFAINFPALNLYSWKSNTQGTVPIIDTTQDVEFVAAGAVSTLTSKGATTGQNLQSSILGIGNYLYVGNPQTNFKWDGPTGAQGKTNWGISNLSTSVNATAGAGSNVGGSNTWTNPNNVTSNVSNATVTLVGNSNSALLTATTFGFSVSGNVSGVQVSFTASDTANSQVNLVQLSFMGSVLGTYRFVTFPSSTGTVTLGGISDLWGNGSIPAAIVNATTFGVQIVAESLTGKTVAVRNVQITVFTGSAPTATPTGSGTFAAVNGFSYVVAYGNSNSGEISNASPVSINTGPFSAKQYVGVTVTASTDTQVNQIRVYRTTDSGGGNQFFEISNSPFANSTATIQDTTLDTALQVTSQAEINLGNTPPPAGLVNLEYFAGRMWGSLANLLIASTGPETISGTAPNSNWNPAFQFLIPQPIQRNVRWATGMIVFTVDDSYIVRGTDITNYTVNEFVKDFGVRTYNAVDTDGTNLYVFTSDRQFILLSASGAQDIGEPIADQLLNVDPTSVYVKVNRYGLDSIVRILDTVNNVYYDYNLNQQCWNLPGILKMLACKAMGSIETSPGVWRLLLSTTNSGTTSLAYRDISNFADLGTTYAPNAVFGSIQLADPGMLVKMGARGGFVMQYTNAGTVPTLSVLPNDAGATLTNAVGSQITGNFSSLSLGAQVSGIPWPPTLANQPTGFRNLGYYYSVARNLSAFLMHLQFQLSAPAENKATELLGWGIFGDYSQEATSAGPLPQLQGK